ncbi:MAG: DNA repair protein [Clostridiales bacterium]|nr:DNA repair protein [Clostridiales bacterium]
MTDKELKRLSRSELLEMLIIQMEENEKMKQRLAEAEAELADRHIRIAEAGTLAEAALRLNDVFAAADQAAAQYLENIKRKAEEERESL